MKKINPYYINCDWDSNYLCKCCGALLYYDFETKEIFCLNSTCKDSPHDIEIFSTEEADLTHLSQQLTYIENSLGQIVKTCDYNILVRQLLENRRRIVENFILTGKMNIEEFLISNDILFFIKKYKSLGIRNDKITFNGFIQLFIRYYQNQTLIENIKEGRYLLARKPLNRIFVLKYYDVIVDEIWASYGQVDLKESTNLSEFHYHKVIENVVNLQSINISTDLAPYYDRLWPFILSFQYIVKRNYPTSLKYQYSITDTDLANILSIIMSLKDNKVTVISIMDFLKHFIRQPLRDKNINDFIDLLDGNQDKIPIIFFIDENIILDRQTMLLFSTLLYSQVLSVNNEIEGQQRIAKFKQEASISFENYIRDKIVESGYFCLPSSTKIGGRDYDVIAVSELKHEIIIVETKFKDPPSSSLSANTLIQQEFLQDDIGLLPELIKHQERYTLLYQRPSLFHDKLGLKDDLSSYNVKSYFITKYTPLISSYDNIKVMSERVFIDNEIRA